MGTACKDTVKAVNYVPNSRTGIKCTEQTLSCEFVGSSIVSLVYIYFSWCFDSFFSVEKIANITDNICIFICILQLGHLSD